MPFINLGYTDKHTMCCHTEGKEDDKEDKIEYPCLYVYDAPKELLDIEKEGEAVIRYRVTSKTESVREGRDGDDEEKNSIDIEIRDFKPVRDESKKPVEVVELTDAIFEVFSKKKD